MTLGHRGGPEMNVGERISPARIGHGHIWPDGDTIDFQVYHRSVRRRTGVGGESIVTASQPDLLILYPLSGSRVSDIPGSARTELAEKEKDKYKEKRV